MSVRWKIKNFTSSYRKSNQKNLRNPFCPQWLLSQFCEVKRFWIMEPALVSDWPISRASEYDHSPKQMNSLGSKHFFCVCVWPCYNARCLRSKMQLFVLSLAGAVCFVSLDVGGAEESSSVSKNSVSSDHHPCTLDRVCEVVDTILQRQDILEKKVKENSKLFGAQPCTEGKIFGDFRSSQFVPTNLLRVISDF